MTMSEKEREAHEAGYFLGLQMAKRKNYGKGWEIVKSRPLIIDYAFKCKDCGAIIEGFVVSPQFCPHCGKEHG